MRKLAKWLDSLTIVVGVAITALACVNGNVQQCVSTFVAVRNVMDQESHHAVSTVPEP